MCFGGDDVEVGVGDAQGVGGRRGCLWRRKGRKKGNGKRWELRLRSPE
jgi:hypothetical protein